MLLILSTQSQCFWSNIPVLKHAKPKLSFNLSVVQIHLYKSKSEKHGEARHQVFEEIGFGREDG